MESLHDLFESLGGRRAVADAAGLARRNTVDYWVKRGRVPYDYWDAIVTLARRKKVSGVDYALLLKLQRPAPRFRAAAE